MDDCIFCKIVKGELPAYKVYEDKDFLGFLDIFPRVKGHTLLIPKKHYRWVYEVPDFGHYWQIAQKITEAVQKSLKPKFVNYFTYGLDVPHAHIHILPRQEKDTAVWPDVIKLDKEELSFIADKIKKQNSM